MPKPKRRLPKHPKPKVAAVPKPSRSAISSDVTVIITNFKTRALLKKAYTTFRRFYPEMRVIVIDNGSNDASTELTRRLGSRPNTTTILIDHNAGHGPAMNKAMGQVDTPYAFLLDTDTETTKGGFIEAMIAKMQADDKLYAVGWRRWVDRTSGVPKEWHVDTPPSNRFIPYIHPSAALIRTSLYHTLSPFFHHGAPCLNNMREAQRRKLKVQSFPIRDYVKHLKAGTRRMYKGRWDPTEKTPRVAWKEKDDYPI